MGHHFLHISSWWWSCVRREKRFSHLQFQSNLEWWGDFFDFKKACRNSPITSSFKINSRWHTSNDIVAIFQAHLLLAMVSKAFRGHDHNHPSILHLTSHNRLRTKGGCDHALMFCAVKKQKGKNRRSSVLHFLHIRQVSAGNIWLSQGL